MITYTLDELGDIADDIDIAIVNLNFGEASRLANKVAARIYWMVHEGYYITKDEEEPECGSMSQTTANS